MFPGGNSRLNKKDKDRNKQGNPFHSKGRMVEEVKIAS
jgi:hypothetical protein